MQQRSLRHPARPHVNGATLTRSCSGPWGPGAPGLCAGGRGGEGRWGRGASVLQVALCAGLFTNCNGPWGSMPGGQGASARQGTNSGALQYTSMGSTQAQAANAGHAIGGGGGGGRVHMWQVAGKGRHASASTTPLKGPFPLRRRARLHAGRWRRRARRPTASARTSTGPWR